MSCDYDIIADSAVSTTFQGPHNDGDSLPHKPLNCASQTLSGHRNHFTTSAPSVNIFTYHQPLYNGRPVNFPAIPQPSDELNADTQFSKKILDKSKAKYPDSWQKQFRTLSAQKLSAQKSKLAKRPSA